MQGKLPPFGKLYADLLKFQKPLPSRSLYLFVGSNAWKKANNFQISRPGTLCLPPYESPSLFAWPVRDCDILIFDTGYCDDDYLNDLSFYLYQHGAKKVRCVLPDFDFFTYNPPKKGF